MEKITEDTLVQLLSDLRAWVRVAAYRAVKLQLEDALPDAKSRAAYQMFDGTVTSDQVRVACKMSPNAVVALVTRCIRLGLMEESSEKRRVRLFDLNSFGLVAGEHAGGSNK